MEIVGPAGGAVHQALAERPRCGIVTLATIPHARSRALSAVGGNRPVLQHGFGAAGYAPPCHARSRASCRDARRPVNRPDCPAKPLALPNPT